MKLLTLKLTVEELRLLVTLASDQLFRKEFIEWKMPGHKSNPAEMDLGKALVGRLRLMVAENSPKKASHRGELVGAPSRLPAMVASQSERVLDGTEPD
jgi:hypothetical protein